MLDLVCFWLVLALINRFTQKQNSKGLKFIGLQRKRKVFQIVGAIFKALVAYQRYIIRNEAGKITEKTDVLVPDRSGGVVGRILQNRLRKDQNPRSGRIRFRLAS